MSIPIELRNDLNDKPYYHQCCLTGKKKSYNTKIDWHHSWLYAGKQINAEWNIFPIWDKMHNYYGLKEAVHNSKDTNDFVKYIAILRKGVKQLSIEYPKKNWMQEFNYLHKKYAREFNSDKYRKIFKGFRRLWSISLSEK